MTGVQTCALPIEGDKAANFLVFGKDSVNCKEEMITVCSEMMRIECKRSYGLKQVGLRFTIDEFRGARSAGRIFFDLSEVVLKLKHASAALRSVSSSILCTEAVAIVRTYVVSVVSYGVSIWYPITFANNIGLLRELRYWYYSVVVYCTMQTKEPLGWCNSSRTMRVPNSIEDKLKKLTGLPSIEDLYRASCMSHYPQVVRMFELGWLEGTVRPPRSSARSDILKYYATDIVSGMVSPLKGLLDTVEKLADVRGKRIEKPLLADLEIDEHIRLMSRKDQRSLQELLTLKVFGIESDMIERKRMRDEVMAVRDREGGFLENWYGARERSAKRIKNSYATWQ